MTDRFQFPVKKPANIKAALRDAWQRLRRWAAGLSFRTGCIVALCCALFYAVSFLQMLLPLPLAAKGALWVVFFGLAKCAQYSALFILGKEGWLRLRSLLGRTVKRDRRTE